MASLQHSSPSPAPVPQTAAILGGVFVVLFVQMQALLTFSLIDYRSVLFVQKFAPQLDLSDFIVATRDWLNGINPYLRQRFDKPPASLLVTIPVQHLTPSHAALVFFVANIAILAAALWAICRHYTLSRVESLLLCGIASMYFPVLFLIERGNLDGIMLGLVLVVIFAKNPFLRALALSLSIGIKLYSGLLFAPLLAARKGKLAALTIALLLLLLIPFHSLLLPFAHRQMGRGAEFHLTENISPAIFVEVFAPGRFSHLVYYCLWLFSYAAMLFRRHNATLGVRMVCSLPWMMALPIHVYAYTGVLLLPVLAMRSREMADWSPVSSAEASVMAPKDYLFLAGFLLAGFQQTAWLAFFHDSLFAKVFCALANPTGTALVMISLMLGSARGTAVSAELNRSLRAPGSEVQIDSAL